MGGGVRKEAKLQILRRARGRWVVMRLPLRKVGRRHLGEASRGSLWHRSQPSTTGPTGRARRAYWRCDKGAWIASSGDEQHTLKDVPEAWYMFNRMSGGR